MKVQLSRISQSWLAKLLAVIGTGSVLILLGSVGINAYQQLQVYKQEEAAWQNVQALETQGEYRQCIEQGATIASESRFYPDATLLIQRCQFAEAQKLAESERLAEAIAALIALSPTAENSGQAETLIKEWSEQILTQAENQFQAGELDKAKEVLNSIPEEAPAADIAKRFQQQWESEWENNATLVQTAEQSLQSGRWLDAKQTLEKVSAHGYWQKQIQPLLTEAEGGIAEVLRYEAAQRQVVTVSFGERFQSLYETFVSEGMAEWDAGILACETLGGIMVDRGPEVACVP